MRLTAVSLFQYLAVFSSAIIYYIMTWDTMTFCASLPPPLLPCDTILISFNDLHLILPVFVAVGFVLYIFSPWPFLN